MFVCVKERKSVCLISMTFSPKLLIFYVQHVVFCKMLLDGRVGFVLYITTYVLVSTIVSEMPIMHQRVRSADERHFIYVCLMKPRGKR